MTLLSFWLKIYLYLWVFWVFRPELFVLAILWKSEFFRGSFLVVLWFWVTGLLGCIIWFKISWLLGWGSFRTWRGAVLW